MKLNTSLLREKFIINEVLNDDSAKKLHLTARSNRLPVTLSTGDNKPEIFIIRTSHMHTCIRMAGAILNEFHTHGPIMSRNPPLKWDLLWEERVLNGYERLHTPDAWCCIYNNGQKVFSYGQQHSFLDIIEKCDAVSGTSYDKAITLAEDSFRKAGKHVKIHYDSNIALVVAMDEKQARSGMVLRSLERSTTFNFYVTAAEKVPIEPAQIMYISAAFLEGVQLAYMVGYNLEKMRVGLLEAYSEEHKKVKNAQQRLIKLDQEITAFNNIHSMRYRPERPNFNAIVNSTEKIAATIVLDDEEAYID